MSRRWAESVYGSRKTLVAFAVACVLLLPLGAASDAVAEIGKGEATSVARQHARDTCKRIPGCLRGGVIKCNRRGNNFWTCKDYLLGLLPVYCTYRVDVFIVRSEITASRAYDSRC